MSESVFSINFDAALHHIGARSRPRLKDQENKKCWFAEGLRASIWGLGGLGRQDGSGLEPMSS
jgi:hypothetical protein